VVAIKVATKVVNQADTREVSQVATRSSKVAMATAILTEEVAVDRVAAIERKALHDWLPEQRPKPRKSTRNDAVHQEDDFCVYNENARAWNTSAKMGFKRNQHLMQDRTIVPTRRSITSWFLFGLFGFLMTKR